MDKILSFIRIGQWDLSPGYYIFYIKFAIIKISKINYRTIFKILYGYQISPIHFRHHFFHKNPPGISFKKTIFSHISILHIILYFYNSLSKAAPIFQSAALLLDSINKCHIFWSFQNHASFF